MTEVCGQRSEVGKTLALRPFLFALSFLGTLLFALSVSGHAQQTGKIARIGFLDPSSASGSAGLVDAFRRS